MDKTVDVQVEQPELLLSAGVSHSAQCLLRVCLGLPLTLHMSNFACKNSFHASTVILIPQCVFLSATQ